LVLPALAADGGVTACCGVVLLTLIVLLEALFPLLLPMPLPLLPPLALAAADIERVEFLRDAALEPEIFLDLVLVPPTGMLEPEPRFLFLMTSVFRLSGRTTPCSLRKRPQALHRGWPSGFRLHRGVVWVKQLVQVVGPLPSLVPPALCRFVVDPDLGTGGDEGRLGATEEKPDTVPGPSPPGELGRDWAMCSNPFCLPARWAGVDAFRGIFCCRLSLPDLKDWDRPSPLPSQSPLLST
jgi:hypothetical protein